MILTVHPQTPVDHGTIVVFTGTDPDGRTFTFGVDHRPAQGLLDALDTEGPIDADVDDFQILGRTA